MGNWREIIQVSPSYHFGVAVPICSGFEDTVAGMLSQYEPGHFYTCIAPPDREYQIVHLTFGRTRLEKSSYARFIIRSGGKMWCGYDKFCEHIESVAPYLHDVHFLIGDENFSIDEFQITDGTLHQEFVNSELWGPLDEYISGRFPELGQVSYPER